MSSHYLIKLPSIALSTLLVVAATQLNAVIAITSGSAIITDLTSTNPDFSSTGLMSDTEIFFFQEQENLTLTQDLIVDITATGTYQNSDHAAIDASSSEFIASGTTVNSYILHLAPDLNDVNYVAAGSITFDYDILGIILTDSKLNATDSILGASNAIYIPLPGLRHSLEPNDVLTLSADRRTLAMDEIATFKEYADQIRIVTAVPEPSTFALITMAFVFGLTTCTRPKRK